MFRLWLYKLIEHGKQVNNGLDTLITADDLVVLIRLYNEKYSPSGAYEYHYGK